MKHSRSESRAGPRERTALARAFGTLALGLAPLLVACTPTPPDDATPEARPEARTDAKGEGCHCGVSEEGDPCECPHCASMSSGFEPGVCRCGAKGRR